MPRRKQNCPKRMKWEGGEGGEEDGSPDNLDGDDTSIEGSSPRGSPLPPEDEDDNDQQEISVEDNSHSPLPPAPLPDTTPVHNVTPMDETENHEAVEESEPLNNEHNSINNDRDVMSPRCQSRGSIESTTPRCPSNEPYVTPLLHPNLPPLSPVGITLPPTLPPAAAAALLPPNSAAMAAYLQHSRLMTSPSAFTRSSSPNEILDFSTKRAESAEDLSKPSSPVAESGAPLDLSRKRSSEETSPQPVRKAPRGDYKWASPLPYFAAAVAAASSLSPPEWNGKLKASTNDASKALEKMSELSKLGGEDLFRVSNSGGTGGNRHSAWQSHWLNKGAEQAKDVLKCVWCKQSFPSLAAMTTHMKEAKHCGVNVPVPPAMSAPPPPHSSPTSSTTSTKSDLNLLIKETMPLPRKLVRGQDVWLGKGAEQTRQILKCMWCGQSFRSLAEMTNHMQQTQHYTNIISQEQIISWKSSDDAKPGNGGGTGGGVQGGPGGPSSHVSAVLTCKVCDQAFSSLKELSNHMVKNSHYKEHIMRSITESGGRRRQTREKRKKSLPVRKLLELERAQHDFKNGDLKVTNRISCEKCGEKIDTSMFVEHIRQCVGGGTLGANQRNFLKNALTESPMIVGHVTPTKSEDSVSPRQHRSPTDLSTKEQTTTTTSSSPSVLNAIEKLIEKSFDSRQRQNAANFGGGNPPLQATPPIGSSILKRLGIDESVDYTKPLVDAQTMNLLRSYHHYNRRERSGSESSSMSERGSRVETPERKMEPPTPPENLVIKKEIIDEDEVVVKKEVVEEEEEEEQQPKPSPPSPRISSPASSDRSATPRSVSSSDKKTNSLGALSTMFDNLSGGNGNSSTTTETPRKTSSHPLAALQKLCDKTETHRNTKTPTPSTSQTLPQSQSSTPTPGAILAFSWACNDAVMTSDSIMKCAFCDTPFISKGAYRHHLSKMHFVKDGAIPDPVSLKTTSSGKTTPVSTASAASGSNSTVVRADSKSPPVVASSPSNFEESPHSKFLKYTELAKQLSSKYV